MAFETVNYAGIAPLGRPGIRDFVQNLAQGYQAARLPTQIAQQEKQRELANAMAQERLREAPELFKSQLGSRALANALTRERINQLRMANDPEAQIARMNALISGLSGPQAQGTAPPSGDADVMPSEIPSILQGMPQQPDAPQQQPSEVIPGLGMTRDQLRTAMIRQALHLPQERGPQALTGIAGQVASLERLKQQYGEGSPQVKLAQNMLDQQRRREEAIMGWRESQRKSKPFTSLTAQEKENALAMARGMGYDPTVASRRLTAGDTLEDLANERGVDLTQVNPRYALATPLVTQVKQRKAFAQEIENLEDNIAQPLASVGRKIFGYSPSQIIGAISNKNPKEQGKILAAYAMQPELMMLRSKSLGGPQGIEAMREMQGSAMARLKVFEPLISPEARAEMNKNISDWIRQSVASYVDSIGESAAIPREPQLRGGRSEQSVQRAPQEKTINGRRFVREGGTWFEVKG